MNIIFFECEKFDGIAWNKEPLKHASLNWFKCYNLPENIISPHKKALEAIAKNIQYSE